MKSNMKQNMMVLSLLASSPYLLADNVNNQINRSIQESKQQLNEVQQYQQQRWIHQHQFQNQSAQPEQNADLEQYCLPYASVKFAGFTLIDPTPFAPQAGECLNEIRLNQLNQAITQAYLAEGYVHNPLQFEDDHSGDLTLRVREGVIAKVVQQTQSTSENTPDATNKGFNLAQIYPHALGKALKIQDLDQALDQANRITGNQVTVDVLPAKNGEIELAFSNEKSLPIAGNIGIDNNAAKVYQRWQLKSAVNIGNPFGLSDSLHFNFAHSLYSSTKFSRSALLYYSIPYGYWTFNSFIAVSQFKLPVHLAYSEFEQKGRTIQGGLSADYVFHRGENHISTFSTQLERIDSKNHFADVMLELQSPVLTSVKVGINHLQLFENASAVFNVQLEQGWNKRKNQPENKYHKWNMELQFSRYQQIGSQLFQHKHQLTGQYSLNYLPSVKQEDLTGRYRVRGFNDLSSSAERNIVLQNTFSWIQHKNNWQFSPYLGIDLGVQKSTTAQSHSEKALSYVAGVNVNHPHWSVNLEWARGRLYSPQGVQQENSLFLSAFYRF